MQTEVQKLEKNTRLAFQRVEKKLLDNASKISSVQKQLQAYLDLPEDRLENGKTPVFGEDFLKEEEMAAIKKGLTPQKGTDYFTAAEIADFLAKITPKKGTDYHDGKPGEPGKAFTWDDLTLEQKTSLKGERGDRGPMPKHEWDGTKIRFEHAPGIFGKWHDLQGPKGDSVLVQKDEFMARAGVGALNFNELFDVEKYTKDYAGKSYRVKADGSGLELYTPTDVAALWGGINGDILDQTDLIAYIAANSASPGGGNKAIQINDSGSLYGEEAYFNYDKTTRRMGLQVASPLAPLHVAAVKGDSILAPATFTATLTLDTAIDRPATASATVVTGPTTPSSFSLSVHTYIDYVQNGGSATQSQNTGVGGFTAYGQYFQWDIFAYRMVNSVRVVNPNYFTLSAYDSYNDSMTTYGWDISGWQAPNSYVDGFIVRRYDSYTGQTYYIDIGNNTSYQDTGFTSTDAYETSAYQSSGTSWNGDLAQYKAVAGGTYRTDYTNTTVTDSNYSSVYLALYASWGALVDDGFYYKSHNGYYFDRTTSTDFYDWGQSTGSVGDASAWSSIAFPYFNTSITGCSSVTSYQIDEYSGSGNMTSDGGSYYFEVWEYRTNPINSTKYFIGSPITSSTFYDGNTSSSCTASGQVDSGSPAGDGSGRVVILYKNSSAVGYSDIGTGSSWSGIEANGTTSTSNALSSYTGLSWDWKAYGYVSSPSLKFSSLSRDYFNTDGNPVGGFIWRHDLATFGNATGMKIIEQNPRSPGYFYYSSTATQTFQTYGGLGDTSVTPSTIGFQANGSNLNRSYVNRTKGTVNGLQIYSPNSITATTTDPNDGLYYTIALAWASVSGASGYKISRSINGGSLEWRLQGGTSLTDDTSYTWSNSDSTVTPTEAPGSAAYFDKYVSDLSVDAAILVLRSTNASSVMNSGIQFTYGSTSNCGRILIDGSGYMRFNSYNNVFDFGGTVSANHYLRLAGGSNDTGAIWNPQNSSSRDFSFKGSASNYLAFYDTIYNSVCFGTKNSGSDPAAAVFIQPSNTSDAVLHMRAGTSSSDSNIAIKLLSNSSVMGFSVTNEGRMYLGANSSNPPAWLGLGPATTSRGQIYFQNTGFDPSSLSSGALYYNSGLLKIHDGSLARIMLTNKNFSNNFIPKYSSTGELTPSGISDSGSIITFSSSWTTLFANGLSVSSGKDISMGSGARFIGGLRYGYATGSASISLNVTNHSPIFVFTGSTASRVLTLPTAVSINGSYFEIVNAASVDVTVATTSSQTIRLVATPTTVVLKPGESIKVVSDGANWVATRYSILQLANTWNGDQVINGNMKLNTAGNGVYIKEGSNATMGVATLVAGTITVNTTKVTANSRIQLTVQSLGTVVVPTMVAVTARTAATSFTITSANATDTSVVAWQIVEPA